LIKKKSLRLKIKLLLTKLITNMKEKIPFIACIDFDHCIANTNPDFSIAGIREGADKVIRKWFDQGIYLIINTCRGRNTSTGYAAEKFLFEHKIPYHQFNEQSVWSREDWGDGIGRKLYGNVYIDDTNLEVQAAGGSSEMYNWHTIDRMVQRVLAINPGKFTVEPDYTDCLSKADLDRIWDALYKNGIC